MTNFAALDSDRMRDKSRDSRQAMRVSAARVLVVEDVPELSRLLEMTFELDGRFEPVGTASSGGAALDLAAREQPDAIVLDVGIDGIDGIDILPVLRRVVPEARIIVFTGHDDDKLRDEAMAAGASAWVLKGGDLSGLLDALSGANEN
jgi:DNA-binding NarL/FixJ family response regulator